MTISGYHIVMKTVRIAELKSRLSEHLRAVRRGEVVTVMDRDTPIARIVPYEQEAPPLVIRRPAPGGPRLADVPLPPPLQTKVDIVELLLEERGER
jgi:prevent-host-death family protein